MHILQGSLHYTPEHCLVNGGFPLFWWNKPCFKWAKWSPVLTCLDTQVGSQPGAMLKSHAPRHESTWFRVSCTMVSPANHSSADHPKMSWGNICLDPQNSNLKTGFCPKFMSELSFFMGSLRVRVNIRAKVDGAGSFV